MKKYIKIYKIVSIIISIPLGWILFLNLIKFNLPGISIDIMILFAFWGSYRLLIENKRFAFVIANLVVGVCWLILLYQMIRRINFIIENNDMESANGDGSPLAFLIGFMTEIYFFIPLSIVFIAGFIYSLMIAHRKY